MAVVQEDIQMVRSVLDYMELNDSVESFTDDAYVCAQIVETMAAAECKRVR